MAFVARSDAAGRSSELDADRRLRVVVADDHPCVTDLLHRYLGRRGVDVVASASDGRAALEAVLEHRPDIAIVDLQIPKLAGLAAVEQIVGAGGPTRVVIFSAFRDRNTALEALRVGARGCVDKASSLEELLRAIRVVARGGTYVDGQPDAPLVTRPERILPLTMREREVLSRTSHGRSSRQIAAELSVSPSTVRAHLRNAAKKLGARNSTHAVGHAIRHAIIP